MPYIIQPYSKEQARKLNVTIKPSTNKMKKIDVYKGDKKIASIGAINYNDYPTYLKKNGRVYADNRRKLYKIRHQNDINKINSPGYFANKLLW